MIDFEPRELVETMEHNGTEASLISVLEKIQARYHYLPREAMILVSEGLGVPLSQVYSVATFYNAFSLERRGRHEICVCVGTACHVRGAVPVEHRIREHLSLGKGEDTTKDMHYTVESIACMGACSLAPVIKIDKKIHSNVLPEEVEHILEEDRGIKKR